jgi:hypothetical protein
MDQEINLVITRNSISASPESLREDLTDPPPGSGASKYLSSSVHSMKQPISFTRFHQLLSQQIIPSNSKNESRIVFRLHIIYQSIRSAQTHSISINAPAGRPKTAKVARAGGSVGKYSA